MDMLVIPALLAIFGIFAGRWYALKKGQCPHRGKVWGAFTLPLLALAVPALQIQAFAVSLAAALAAGFTAHQTIKTTLIATTVAVALATFAVHSAGL